MEPFGLFQFLQSLLTNPSASPLSGSDEPTETKTPPSTEHTPAEPSPQANNEAYLQFIANHEKRAKQTRKP